MSDLPRKKRDREPLEAHAGPPFVIHLMRDDIKVAWTGCDKLVVKCKKQPMTLVSPTDDKMVFPSPEPNVKAQAVKFDFSGRMFRVLHNIEADNMNFFCEPLPADKIKD